MKGKTPTPDGLFAGVTSARMPFARLRTFACPTHQRPCMLPPGDEKRHRNGSHYSPSAEHAPAWRRPVNVGDDANEMVFRHGVRIVPAGRSPPQPRVL